MNAHTPLVARSDGEPGDLVDLLRQRAARQAERRAFIFLEHETETVISYAELDRRARRIAAELQRRGCAGQRALLLYPPGLEYLASFFGCLYAGVVAVPVYPPDPARLERTLPRLLAIVADAQATVALSTAWIVGIGQELAEVAPELGTLSWIGSDELPEGGEDAWRQPMLRPEDLAFLQYTSGSTRTPRGVRLSHANLLANSAQIAAAFGPTEASVGVSWLPPYHDMGLIGGLLQPVYRGFLVVVMEPMAFLQRPRRWLEAITRYGADQSGGPNFAYDLCVRRIAPEERAGLDLSSWQVAFNGAEPVRAQTLARFSEAFGPYGFQPAAHYPCYGLAEATLLVAGRRRGTGARSRVLDAKALTNGVARPAEAGGGAVSELVGVGRVIPGHELLIVDPETSLPAEAGRVGEIWLRGPSVAGGYWGRPEETAATFAAATADGRGPFLRTGDLGLLLDGELHVAGRIKDLIIVDGRNHYPQEIELTVEQSHAGLRPGCVAAFAVEEADAERLVVVGELERTALTTARGDGAAGLAATTEAIAAAARQAVAAAHDLRLHALVLLVPGALPKTSSGKIQRHACRRGYLEGSLEPVGVSAAAALVATDAAAPAPGMSREQLLATAPAARRGLVEAWLATLAARTLRLAPGTLAPGEALSARGLDSLGAVELTSAIEAATGVTVEAVRLLRGDSLATLATLVLDGLAAAPKRASGAEPEAPFPLSYGQRAIWFLQQLTPATPVYTLMSGARVVGALDEAALRAALGQLIARHPALRMVVASGVEGPLQRALPAGAAALEVEDGAAWDAAELARRIEAAVFAPFDLERGPLLRAWLFRRGPGEAIVLLAAHHLITDFWSLALLLAELRALYEAAVSGRVAELPPPTASYADYVRWEREAVAGPQGELHWQYWRGRLGGELPVLDLPTDQPRPAASTYRGATCTAVVDAATARGLAALARANGATTFMAMLAVFQVLLQRYSGAEELVVGVPRAMRRLAWARTMGFCVNTLAIRTAVRPEQSFAALLGAVRQEVLAAFEHADYPFALLVERLQPRRDPSRSPIFQVMLAWQKTARMGDNDRLTPFALNQAGGVLPMGAARLESLALPQRVVPFDLTLLAGEEGEQIRCSLEYNADLFSATTAERMLGHLVTLLEGAVASPETAIGDLPLLSADERQALLGGPDEAPSLPMPLVHELFAAQAARSPGAAALRWWDGAGALRQLSYGDLERRSNQLASYLRGLGVGPEQLVGVCLERSPELIIALLAVLKAGGVFLPLDPDYPLERLSFMLADAGAVALLTEDRLAAAGDLAGGAAPQLVRLDADAALIAAAGDLAPTSGATAGSAAYVIYTSGSTGVPKGVLIEHGAFAAHCMGIQRHYELTAGDRVLQFAALSFDAALEQIVPTLMSGATLVLRAATLWTPEEFRRRALEAGLTVINLPPAYWAQLVAAWAGAAPGEPAPPIRLVIIGGDQIPPESLADWQRSPLAGVRLLNAYGPTETTITATTCELSPVLAAAPGPVPIGRPLAGRRAYVLDARGNLAPPGVAGELVLGGVGVARGYLGRPELTRARFEDDPLSGRAGARRYRTGDLVRLGPDGKLIFLGRVDEQVKIRGFRVEPGEIASVLRRHSQVADALVVAQDLGGGERRLVAYLVAADAAPGPTAAELRAQLRRSLPEFMLPSAFVVVERWPLTPSGKIDRRALPLPEGDAGAEVGYVAPRNAVEAAMAELWGELLERPVVGVRDDFFALGGHSLLATRLVARVHEQFGVELPLRSLFDAPTVEASAAVLVAQLAGADGVGLEALLDELEQLPGA